MAGTLTSSLIVRLIDQVTGPARKVAGSLLGLNRAANSAGGFGQRLGNAIQRNNRALDDARGKMVDAVAGFYALKAAIGGPIQAAMEFESAMADVKKVVDFPTPQAFKDFQKSLIDLSKTVPLSVNGLAQIAAAAGQAGIAGNDLIKFTEAAAKVGVAFDISADAAGDAMAKMMTGLGLTIDQTVLLSDAMNHLSNQQASTAAEILDVVRRVGAQSKQFGYSAEQVAAFASAMIASGAESEVAATSFRNMGNALTRGASATKAQRGAYARLGLDAKKVAKSMQKDAVGMTVEVIRRIGELPAHLRAATASDLFGNEARALGPLLTNIDLLTESLGLVDNQAKYAGSSFKEFQVRAETFQNSVQVFNNRLTALKIVIGGALIPAVNELLDRLTPLVEKFTDFADAHPELIRNVMSAVASLVAFKIAASTLRFVGLIGRGGALSMLAFGFNTIGRAAIGATRATQAAVGLQAALAAMSGAKYSGLAKIGTALRAMVFAVPGVSAISGALSAIGGALAAISAPAWAAVAVAVGAVAFAGGMLWKYWDRVSSVVSGVSKRIGEELQPVIEHFSKGLEPFKFAVKGLGEGFEWAGKKIGEFSSWLGSFLTREILSDEQIASFEQAGYKVADAFINSIKTAVNGLVDWFRSLPGRIVDAIGQIDLTGVFKMPSFLGGGGGGGEAPAPSNDNSASPPISGHRATGGRVWAGSSFIVNEKDQEVFTPDRSGTVSPIGGAGAGPVQIGPFHITGSTDPAETARQISRQVSDELARALRGTHSDSGAYA